MSYWRKGLADREADPHYPDKFIESKKSHCIRAIEHLLNRCVTNFEDISTLIRKEFGYSSSIVSQSRKELRESCIKKVEILQKETPVETSNRKTKEKFTRKYI